MKCYIRLALVIVTVSLSFHVTAQFKPKEINWTDDGTAYLKIRNGDLIRTDIKTGAQNVVVDRRDLTPAGSLQPLDFDIFTFSKDKKHLLIFTNTARVWRYNTRGDYYVLNLQSKELRRLGKPLPSQSLMFAKFAPNGKMVAYVSGHNIYAEDISDGTITQLTFTGTRKFINGTFDWVYEEEFGARDGFRWSDNSENIAYWQVDATGVRDFYMLNTTDSQYSKVIPVEYPKVGQPPSPVQIGVVNLKTKKTVWIKVPGDPQQHYIPRMEWVPNSDEIVLQQLNRKQNESRLFYCKALSGDVTEFYSEADDAFIDIKSRWNHDDPTGWDWIDNGSAFLWVSEKDGWRHIYSVSRNGKEKLITKGDYDIASVECIDEEKQEVYFMASPFNVTQLYLYKVKLGGGTAELVTPSAQKGTHKYNISPNALYALHSFSNHNTFPAREWIKVSGHRPLDEQQSIEKTMRVNENSNVKYFKVTTVDDITLDGWMAYPANFDSTKKYPVVFYVYGEPASSTINDTYGTQNNFLFNGDMSIEGYFQISVDNRGTPSLRGRQWRKSIYGRLGRLNIHDQAMAARKILEKPWFDKDRVAVWGWSGGGSSTMNLMFQYPEIYKTGIAIAAVTNLLF